MELIERVADALRKCEMSDGDWMQDFMAVWVEDDSDDMKRLAKAAIRAVLDGVESNLSAVQYDPAPYTAMKYRIAAMRKEAE